MRASGRLSGREAFTFAALQAPQEDAFEIEVTKEQEGLLGLKRLREFFEKKAKRFGEALFDLHGGGDGGEKMILRGEAAAAVAEKGQARAGGEHGNDDGDPGEEMEAASVAFDHVYESDEQSESAGDRNCGAKSPAAARCVGNKQERKPDGHGERAEVNENDDERQGRSLAASTNRDRCKQEFEYDDCEAVDEIADRENRGNDGSRRDGGPLKDGKNGKKNDDRARDREFAARNGGDRSHGDSLGAHARGRNPQSESNKGFRSARAGDATRRC